MSWRLSLADSIPLEVAGFLEYTVFPIIDIKIII